MTSLLQDKDEAQHQVSVLLFVGLACGLLMFLFTRFCGTWALTGNKDWYTFGLVLHYGPFS